MIAGFHAAERPDAIVDIDEACLLPEGPIAEVWKGLRAGWGPGANLLPEGKTLRLTLRANRAGEVLLLIAEGRGAGDPEALLARVPGLRAVWFDGAEGGRPKLRARIHIVEDCHGTTIELHPGAFLPGQRDGPAELEEVVLREIGDLAVRRDLDLYCGCGL
jgi:hypothetical protein